MLAGKTGTDNDRLSIKMAKANDWWFHVRGMTQRFVPGASRKVCQKSPPVRTFRA